MKKTSIYLIVLGLAILFTPNFVYAVNTSDTLKHGQLVKDATSKAVYYIRPDNKKYPFPDAGTYYSWYVNFARVKKVEKNVLNKLSTGSFVTVRPGVKLVKFEGSDNVYAIDNNEEVRRFSGTSVVKSIYGSYWYKYVVELPYENITHYVIGEDIKRESDYDKKQITLDNYSITIVKNLKYPSRSRVVVSPTTVVKPSYSNLLTNIEENLRGNLSPKFNDIKTSYYLKAGYGENSITIKPVAKDKTAEIWIENLQVPNGKSLTLKLETGTNYIDIKVNPKEGYSKVYRLRVSREVSRNYTNAYLTNIRVTTARRGTFTPSFDPTVEDYEVKSLWYLGNTKIYVYPKENDSAIYIDGLKTRSRNIPLGYGQSKTVYIRVVAYDGTSKTYTIDIEKEERP